MEQNSPEVLPREPIKQEPQIKPSKGGNFLTIFLSILLLISVLIAGFFAYQTQKLVKELSKKQIETPSPNPITSEIPTPLIDPTSDWEAYKNEELGFEIKYPENYKQVGDTYGWPKAVLLLYKGGQSYDLVVEVWNSKSEYLSKYNNEPAERLVAQKVGTKFVTLLNMNEDVEVAKIIETFKITSN